MDSQKDATENLGSSRGYAAFVECAICGRHIPRGERCLCVGRMDEQIDVWEVSPHINTDYDMAVFCDHTKAIRYVVDLAESIVDELGHGDEATITIRHTTMARGDFNECCEN